MTSPHTPENWNDAAAEYDEAFAAFTAGYADEVFARLQPGADQTLLEVACGPGNVTVQLAPRCRRVLATDYAESMLVRLQERLAQHGLDNVDAAHMNGQDLDVDDDSFDGAMSHFGVMLFDDRAAGFRELHRAVRPGGRVVVTGWSTPERFEPFGLFGMAVRRALPDLPPPPAPPPIFSLADPVRFQREMEQAGFADVRVEHATRAFEPADSDAFFELMRSGAPPVRILFQRIGPDGVARVREALSEILHERFGNGPITLASEATIGMGTVSNG